MGRLNQSIIQQTDQLINKYFRNMRECYHILANLPLLLLRSNLFFDFFHKYTSNSQSFCWAYLVESITLLYQCSSKSIKMRCNFLYISNPAFSKVTWIYPIYVAIHIAEESFKELVIKTTYWNLSFFSSMAKLHFQSRLSTELHLFLLAYGHHW